jgi:uncharacterized protein YggE
MDKKRWTFAALFAALSVSSSAQESTTHALCPAITAGGEATVRAAPNRAFLTVTTEGRAGEPEAAQQQSATAMASVQAKLKVLDIQPEAIRTVRYDLQPRYDYIKGRQTLRGYVANNAIEVRVDDLSRVGAIIDAAVDAGGTSVAGVRFALKDRDEVEREALKQAVADARAGVDAAASAAGVTVERIWSVDQERMRHGPPVPMMSVGAEAAQDAPTPVAPGPIEVRARVTLTACIR